MKELLDNLYTIILLSIWSISIAYIAASIAIYKTVTIEHVSIYTEPLCLDISQITHESN